MQWSYVPTTQLTLSQTSEPTDSPLMAATVSKSDRVVRLPSKEPVSRVGASVLMLLGLVVDVGCRRVGRRCIFASRHMAVCLPNQENKQCHSKHHRKPSIAKRRLESWSQESENCGAILRTADSVRHSVTGQRRLHRAATRFTDRSFRSLFLRFSLLCAPQMSAPTTDPQLDADDAELLVPASTSLAPLPEDENCFVRCTKPDNQTTTTKGEVCNILKYG